MPATATATATADSCYSPAEDLTLTECAARLGVAEQCIRRANRAGRLPSRVVLGRSLVRRSDFEKYAAEFHARRRGRPPKTARQPVG